MKLPLEALPRRPNSAFVSLEEALHRIALSVPKSSLPEDYKKAKVVDPELDQFDFTISWNSMRDRAGSWNNYDYSKFILDKTLTPAISKPSGENTAGNSLGQVIYAEFIRGMTKPETSNGEADVLAYASVIIADQLETGSLAVHAICNNEAVIVPHQAFKVAGDENVDFIRCETLTTSFGDATYSDLRVNYGDLHKILKNLERTGLPENRPQSRPKADSELMNLAITTAGTVIRNAPRPKRLSKIFIAKEALKIYINRGGRHVNKPKTITHNFNLPVSQVLDELKQLKTWPK